MVRVTDSDGRVGLGEAPQNWQVLGSSVAGSAACLEGPLREAVLGRSSDPAETWPVIDRAVAGNGAAKAALDCALHDLAGVAAPLHGADAWSRCRSASRTRSRRRRGRGWPRASGRSSSRSAPTRPRTWPGCGPPARARVRTWRCGSTPTPAGTASRRSASSRALEDAGVGVQLVEQPVGRRDLLGPGPRAPARGDPGDGRRVRVRPRRPRRAGPPRRGRPGQHQDRQGRRPHPGPRAGPGRAGARTRCLGRLHARVGGRGERRGGAGRRGRLRRRSRPGRRVVAGAGRAVRRPGDVRRRQVVAGWAHEGSARGRRPPRPRRGRPSGSPRWRSARRSSSSSSRASGPGCSRPTSRPTSTRPATRAGSAATRSRTTTRSRWLAASSARRTSGAGWAATASTARGWCT